MEATHNKDDAAIAACAGATCACSAKGVTDIVASAATLIQKGGVDNMDDDVIVQDTTG